MESSNLPAGFLPDKDKLKEINVGTVEKGTSCIELEVSRVDLPIMKVYQNYREKSYKQRHCC